MNWHKLRVGQLEAPTTRLIRKASQASVNLTWKVRRVKKAKEKERPRAGLCGTNNSFSHLLRQFFDMRQLLCFRATLTKPLNTPQNQCFRISQSTWKTQKLLHTLHRLYSQQLCVFFPPEHYLSSVKKKRKVACSPCACVGTPASSQRCAC